MVEKILKNKFLFEELVKRDFKLKYKRTVLGMFWSILSPLLMLTVMAFIFGNFFGRNIEHFIIYLFSGQIVFNYFIESTNNGMNALVSNAKIFSKINVPKYLFLLSKNVSSLINFCIILLVYFLFIWLDGIKCTWKFILLVYPIICLIMINLGMGLLLSALYVFFKDIQYLYRIFTQIVMYGSAIFYSIEKLPNSIQFVFYCNPIFCIIHYIREIVLKGNIPDAWLHALIGFYSLVVLLTGIYTYHKYNNKFIFYI